MNDIFWQPGITLEEVERRVIEKAIAFYRGNKTATASALGIAIRTLDDRLATYNYGKAKPHDQPERSTDDRLESKTERAQSEGSDDVQSQARLHVESSKKSAEKSAVPVRRR